MQESVGAQFLRLFALTIISGGIFLNGAPFFALVTKASKADKPAIIAETAPAPDRFAPRVVASAEMQGKRAKSETARTRVLLPNVSRGAGSAPALTEPSVETVESVDAEAEVMPLPRLFPAKAIAMFVPPAPPLPVRSPMKASSAARSKTPLLPVRAPEEARISIADSVLQQTGRASWYALDSLTANGETLDHAALTAAHNYLPFGTKVRIENIANGLSVVVRINDRGPFVGGRIIDLSKAAAEAIGMLEEGVADVRLSVVYDRVAITSGG